MKRMTRERAEYIRKNTRMGGDLRFAFKQAFNVSTFEPDPDGITKEEDDYIKAVWSTMPGSSTYGHALDRIAKGTETLPELIKHSSSYEGNGRSGEHLNACLNRKRDPHDMCEIKMSCHISFTPDHPAAKKLLYAINFIENVLAEQEVYGWSLGNPRGLPPEPTEGVVDTTTSDEYSHDFLGVHRKA